MKITYETLREFVRANDDVKLFAPNKGELTILKDGTPSEFAIIADATTFWTGGKEYTREEFERLLDERKSK